VATITFEDVELDLITTTITINDDHRTVPPKHLTGLLVAACASAIERAVNDRINTTTADVHQPDRTQPDERLTDG